MLSSTYGYLGTMEKETEKCGLPMHSRIKQELGCVVEALLTVQKAGCWVRWWMLWGISAAYDLVEVKNQVVGAMYMVFMIAVGGRGGWRCKRYVVEVDMVVIRATIDGEYVAWPSNIFDDGERGNYDSNWR